MRIFKFNKHNYLKSAKHTYIYSYKVREEIPDFKELGSFF